MGRGRLLIKFVRGNGAVGFLKRRYGLPKPLVVIRHPCAVVASQLRMGQWQDHPHIDPVMLDRMPELEAFLDGARPLHERLAVTWAVDVAAALESRADLHIVHYETLFTQGAEVLRPALASWGVYKLPDQLFATFAKRSSTTHGWSELDDPSKHLSRWKRDLDETQAEQVLNICREIGVGFYDKSPLPIDMSRATALRPNRN